MIAICMHVQRGVQSRNGSARTIADDHALHMSRSTNTKRSIIPRLHVSSNNLPEVCETYSRRSTGPRGILQTPSCTPCVLPYHRDSSCLPSSIASLHAPPYFAVNHVAIAAATKKPALMVLNHPTPIFSMTGKHAALPAAANM